MSDFSRNVFINCPFDDEYEPILQAILFTILRLGFEPRLASEANDSGEVRLDKIRELIEASKFSIHDLSRCVARKKGEHFRLNMPFELGIDYGCRRYFGRDRDQKRFLILEEKKYRYQAALADIAGCEIEAHGANFENAVRKVRNWLVSAANAENVGAAKILNDYLSFQEWYVEMHLAAGADLQDIRQYPTSEFLAGMRQWFDAGCPPSYD